MNTRIYIANSDSTVNSIDMYVLLHLFSYLYFAVVIVAVGAVAVCWLFLLLYRFDGRIFLFKSTNIWKLVALVLICREHSIVEHGILPAIEFRLMKFEIHQHNNNNKMNKQFGFLAGMQSAYYHSNSWGSNAEVFFHLYQCHFANCWRVGDGKWGEEPTGE